jgi:hypothetical protein
MHRAPRPDPKEETEGIEHNGSEKRGCKKSYIHSKRTQKGMRESSARHVYIPFIKNNTCNSTQRVPISVSLVHHPACLPPASLCQPTFEPDLHPVFAPSLRVSRCTCCDWHRNIAREQSGARVHLKDLIDTSMQSDNTMPEQIPCLGAR